MLRERNSKYKKIQMTEIQNSKTVKCEKYSNVLTFENLDLDIV